jgi:hypothetical protein
VGIHNLEHFEWGRQIRTIHFKKHALLRPNHQER